MKGKIKSFLHYLGWDLVRYPSPAVKAFKQILTTQRINTVLDVGANAGLYAKDLRQLGYTQTIVSFEPVIGPYHQLENYAKGSKYAHKVFNLALGNFDGMTAINVSQNLVSSSILEGTELLFNTEPRTAYHHKQTIPIKRLDSIFNEICLPGKDKVFLKLDVQGYERKVMDGARDSLPYISGIQLEVSLAELYKDEWLLDEMLPTLQSWGYRLYLLIPGFYDFSTGRLLQTDCVFLRTG